MNINENLHYEIPNNQQAAQVSWQTQENTRQSGFNQQNTQQILNTEINDRLVDKFVKTKNLVGTFSNNVLDKLMDKEFFIKEINSWRNRMHYVFKNEKTGKKIIADEDHRGSLNTQVLSALSKLDTMETRVNRLTNLSVQNNIAASDSNLNFWVSMIEKTLNSISIKVIEEASINRAIAKGFYLDKVEDYTKNIVVYTFKSIINNHTFYITNENQKTLTEQLNNELSKIEVRTTTTTSATNFIPANINTLINADISSIESYGYKIIVVSRALANLSTEDRILLLHDMNNPYVDNITLFKDLILKSISHAANNSIQDKESYLTLIQNTQWNLVEINTIIRKGILLLDD